MRKVSDKKWARMTDAEKMDVIYENSGTSFEDALEDMYLRCKDTELNEGNGLGCLCFTFQDDSKIELYQVNGELEEIWVSGKRSWLNPHD